MQERVQTGFCPAILQVLKYLTYQTAVHIVGSLKSFLLVLGGGGAFWAENVHVLGPKCTCAYFVFSLTG